MDRKDEGRAMLGIARILLDRMANKLPVLQWLAEDIAEVLDVGRCVIFKCIHAVDGIQIQIAAGVPIEEHGVGLTEPIKLHPDIEESVRFGKVMVIHDPHDSPLTKYFRSMIRQKSIAEILYVPVRSSGIITGVIVIDAVGAKVFTEDEIQSCGDFSELIALLIDHEEIKTRYEQDLFGNSTTVLGGFTARQKKQILEIQDLLKALRGQVQEAPKTISEEKASEMLMVLETLEKKVQHSVEIADIIIQAAKHLEDACPRGCGIVDL